MESKAFSKPKVSFQLKDLNQNLLVFYLSGPKIKYS